MVQQSLKLGNLTLHSQPYDECELFARIKLMLGTLYRLTAIELTIFSAISN